MNKPFAFFSTRVFPVFSTFLRSVFLALSISVCILSCQSPAPADNGAATENTASPAPAARNPEFRKTVKTEAVASYSEKTDNPLNDWYFTVKMYETNRTLEYRLTLQFEEITGTDTLDLPDFGTPPQPVIQKGTDKYSCVIGFLDNEKKFREYKKVYVKDGNRIKLTTLRRYSVTGKAE